jgi:hypothetical protein
MVKFAKGLLKIAVLVLVVVLGIVFMPGGLMDWARAGFGSAKDYTSEQTARYAPGLESEFSRKVAQTKEDIGNLYKKTIEEYIPSVQDWFQIHQLERQ